MKKSLLALAVLGAFAGAAQAQTSVTVYGNIDAGIRHQSHETTANLPTGDSVTTMGTTGTFHSSRIGFKGVEDLGNGLNAHFVLETRFQAKDGKQSGDLFKGGSYVGLGGSWGAVDLGRQHSVNFETIGAYDPFKYRYTGIIPTATQGGLTFLNSDIQYTGKFGPVTAQAEYALGEVAGSTSKGSTQAVGVRYAGGPFTVGGAYTQQTTTADLDKSNWTIGGAYATGPFRVALGYAKNEADVAGGGDNDIKDWWLGGSYALTPAAALTAGYYNTKATSVANVEAERKLFIIGATYALSKRTTFYADIDSARFDNNAGVDVDNVNSFSVGIDHAF